MMETHILKLDQVGFKSKVAIAKRRMLRLWWSGKGSGEGMQRRTFEKPTIIRDIGEISSHQSRTPFRPKCLLDHKIINAVKELGERQKLSRKGNRHEPFNKIMLKFPSIAKAFNSSRAVFLSFDSEKKGYINQEDVHKALKSLGANFDKEEIDEMFEASDLSQSGHLDFKEFLVCLALGFVLHRVPSLDDQTAGKLGIFYNPLPVVQPNGSNKEITPKSMTCFFGEGNKLRAAFLMVVEAFLWFDLDGSGTIQRDEMASRLQEMLLAHSPTKNMSRIAREKNFKNRPPSEYKGVNIINSFITDKRFNEMDWDHDGYITFKEFLMAFESWVGIDEDDEK